MKANPGDQIIVDIRDPRAPSRRGQVIDVLGTGTDQRYLIRWQDGHESVYLPGPGFRVLEIP